MRSMHFRIWRDLLLSATLLGALPAQAATKTWAGGVNGNWDLPANWSAVGEPVAADTANIFDGTNPLVTSTGNQVTILNVGGSALGGGIVISGGGALTVTTRTIFGQGAGQTGTGMVSGVNSLLTANGELNIGSSGIGEVTLSSGGKITGGVLNIGLNAGSDGALDIAGAGSLASFSGATFIGKAGTGEVNITGAGQLTNTNAVSLGTSVGGDGTVTVDGVGSLWQTNSSIVVGVAGTGVLDVLNGGRVNASSTAAGSIVLGQTAATGNGTINVSGSNSLLNASGSMVIGQSGTGSVNITNSGAVTLGGTFTLGSAAGSSGALIVSGAGSTLTANGNTNFIGSVGTGSMSVTNGATANVKGVQIGYQSNGTLTVDGVGSSVKASASLTVGNFGNGTINVLNGASLTQTGGAISLGGNSTGTLNVDGVGSTVAASSLTLGSLPTGVGTATFSNGAVFNGATVILGNTTGANGTLNVLSGSNFNFANMTMANGGTATINVGSGADAGGTVSGNGISGSGGNGTINFNHTNAGLIFNPSISGRMNINQIGTGTTILTANSNFTGTTTIGNGALQLGNGGTSGSITSTINVASGADLIYYRQNNGLTIGNAIAGAGTVSFRGTGVVDQSSYSLSKDNSAFTGGFVIESDAKLSANNANQLGGATVTVEDGGGLSLGGNQTYGNAISLVGLGWNETAGQLGALRLVGGATVSGLVTLIGDTRITTYLDTDTGTISGVIDDGGNGYALEKTGSGTLVLTGLNTYTGITSISDGTLQLGDGGTTGSISSASIVDNGTLAINRNDTYTYGGIISGSGNLLQEGNGTTILTGDSVYSGTTTITAGALQLGNGGATGGIGDNSAIVNDGALSVNRSNTYIQNGLISGTGSFSQDGTGTTIFTGDNTYTGITTITNGTLQLGNGGATGNLSQSAIVDDSHLVINRSGTSLMSGDITGTGDLTQAGPGTLILTGENAYTGGTIISGGTLQVGNGGSTGNLIGPITNDSHLVLNRSGYYEFNGVVTGTGDLTKDGPGLTKIMNTQAYTGATHVTGGELRAQAANILGTTSGLTVDSGAIFSANAYDQNVGTLLNNGIVNMFGVGPDANLTVSTLSGGGIFGLTTNLAGGFGDHVAVTGASSGAHYLTILNSGGVPASLGDTLELVSTTDSSTGGATFRQLGDGVDVGVYNYTVQRGNGSAGLPDVNNWYLALSPQSRSEVAKAIIGTAAVMSNSWFTQMDNLHRRMGKQRLVDPSVHENETWVRGYSREINVDASVTGRAFDERISGIDVGIDRLLSRSNGNTWIGGLFAGYGWADRDFNDYGSSGDTKTPYAGVYATWFNGNNYYADLTAKLQYFDNSFDAADASGNIHHGGYHQWGYGTSAEFGKRFDVSDDGWILQPQVQLQYVRLTGRDYTTQFGSQIQVEADNIFQMRGGLELGKSIPQKNGGLLYPYGRVSVIEQVSSGGDIEADTLSFDADMDGAVLEYGVGVIYQMDEVHQGYLAVTRSEGESYDQRWGVNIGFRYEF